MKSKHNQRSLEILYRNLTSARSLGVMGAAKTFTKISVGFMVALSSFACSVLREGERKTRVRIVHRFTGFTMLSSKDYFTRRKRLVKDIYD